MSTKTTFGIFLASGKTKDKPIYAGQPLKGKICFEIEKEVKTTGMKLQFFGAETSSVEYTIKPNESGGFIKGFKAGRRNIINVDVPLNQSQFLQRDGRVLPGKYELPFVIELPEVLPSVMKYKGTSDAGTCEIFYRLKATLEGSGKQWNYTCETDVVVLSKPLSPDPVPFKAKPVEHELTSMCCLNNGLVIFGVRVNDTRLDKGETTKISVSGRNRSSLNIPSVTAAIRERCDWTAANYANMGTKELQKIDLGTFNGLVTASPNDRNKSVDTDYADILREIEANQNEYEITMPVDVKPTYNGTLINCNHFLELTLNTSGIFASLPVISVPLQAGEARTASNATATIEDLPEPKVTTVFDDATGDVDPSVSISCTIPEGFSAGAKTTNPVFVPERMLSLGGLPVMQDKEDATSNTVDMTQAVNGDASIQNDTEKASAPDDSSVGTFTTISSSSTMASSKPRVAALIEEMEESVDDWTIVQTKLKNRTWRNVLRMVTPEEYGKLLQQVNSDFDQPRIAVALAEVIRNFSAMYIIAALQSVQEWNRIAVLERLLPLCKELSTTMATIKEELTEWEQMVSQEAFSEALKKAQ